MTEQRQRTGRQAEQLACEALAIAGARVVERNARVRYSDLGIAGELDVIALHRGTLAFVEVKAGRSGAQIGPVAPALAVGRRKQQRLRTLARAWLASNRPPPHAAIRFDVIAVSFDRRGVTTVEWIRDAF